MARRIGTLQEKSLHAALKAHYAQPGDQLEYALDGYVIDIVRAADESPQCIEIQTGSFGSMKPKLNALLDRYPVRVVYPIARERFIVRIDADGVIVSRRKSPKRGSVYDLFAELVSLPTLIQHPHFTLEALLIRDEQILRDDGRGSWRRKRWSIADRCLIEVGEAVTLSSAADFAALLPADLPPTFTSRDLANALRCPLPTAQKMLYCLRAINVVTVTGKQRRALTYCRTLDRV